METHFELKITEECYQSYKRLDQYLVDKLEDQSRSRIKALFESGKIALAPNSPVNDKLSLKKMPKVGVHILIEIPAPLPSKALPEDIPLEIIYEDEHLVFVNKPAGLVTHPAPGNYTGTLVNAILHHCPDIQGVGEEKRPGIVHRLDKGTSGIMVIAKTQKCHQGLVELFSTHTIERVYECIVMGTKIPAAGTLTSTLGRHPQNRLKMAANIRNGKEAITHYRVVEYYDKCTHMEVKLETGRTHQIRVHMSSLLRKPIMTDPLYGNPKEHLQRVGGEIAAILKNYEHPLLHAKTLGLVHPITKEELSFTVRPPAPFSLVLDILKD